ncbi:hypothetical protein [Kordiimonas aquimaris]|uniref:hypothetical protein n=1 Tax=Kordiimonas aquimaris TaxID=707591 RepID=UPI0021D3373B|nr:hypothetical protein [Kordiimonas aquimaris]
MIKKVAFAALIAAAAAGAYISYNKITDKRCNDWLDTATTLQNDGYHADAIKELTLYFSQSKCRSKSDVAAVKLLSEARLEVPLPDNAHTNQQLLLTKLGWNLQRDTSYSLTEASANLVRGDWYNAQKLARRVSGAKAALIGLSASLRLQDLEAAEEDLLRFSESDASLFQWAMILKLLRNNGDLLAIASQLAPDIPSSFARLAAKSTSRQATTLTQEDIKSLSSTLSDNDLAVATSLLVSQGDELAAIALLNQPTRLMPGSLLKRHARLLWKRAEYDVLSSFLTRPHSGIIPAEVNMIVCLAQKQLNQSCRTGFNQHEYKRRHGIYTASRWGQLLKELEADTINPSRTIDALSNMKNIVTSSAIAHQLLENLYRSIGEEALAGKHEKHAQMLGLGNRGVFVRNMINKETKSCGKSDTSCMGQKLYADSSNFDAWRTALAAGYKPEAALLEQLREKSPNEATLWRVAKARSAIAKETDDSMAEGLRLLRPVLKWAPDDATSQLLASAGYAYFDDLDAAYAHLATAAKTEPDSAIAALRLTIKYYEEGRNIGPAELAHWWTSISRLEMQARGIMVTSESTTKLLTDRLSILAAYSEQNRDYNLAIASYRAILEISPENHMALNNLAVRLLDKNKDLDRAEKMALQAVKLEPGQQEYNATLKDIQTAIKAAL